MFLLKKNRHLIHPMIQMRKTVFFLIVLCASLCGCRKPVPKEQAERYLRAMDQTLLQMVNDVEGRHALDVLMAVFEGRNAPIPFYAHKTDTTSNIRHFDFSQHTGLYLLDTINKVYYRTDESDSIVLYATERGLQDAMRLVVSSFQERYTNLDMMFPEKISMALYHGDNMMMQLQQDAGFNHGYPAYSNMVLYMENYHMTLSHRVIFRKKTSKLTASLRIVRDGEALMDVAVRANIMARSEGGFAYASFEAMLNVFPVRAHIFVKQSAIDPYTTDYPQAFNSNSRIRLSAMKDGRSLGKVQLLDLPGKDKLQFAVVYMDGSYTLLDELMLTMRHVMHTKLPRQE